MKKYFIIFLFLSTFLSACQKMPTTSLDFYQSKIILSEQIEKIISKYNNLNLGWSHMMDTKFSIQWENKDFKVDSQIVLSWFLDNINNERDIQTNANIYFWDKKEKKENIFSGDISHKKTKDKKFFKLNNIFVDTWSWNYQDNLVLLISKNLENKRISKNDSHESRFFIYQDITFLLQSITNLDVFMLTQTVKYEKNVAYRIQIKPDILEYLNQNLHLKIKDFDGLLVVLPNWEVILKIENLSFVEKDIAVKWEISTNKWYLDIKNSKSPNLYYNLSWNFYKDQIQFVYRQILDYEEVVGFELMITNKIFSDFIRNKFYWKIIISPKIIYWSALEKNIQIDINGEQKIYKQSGYVIDNPTSYILFDQILWDEFSLKKLMSNENVLTTN